VTAVPTALEAHERVNGHAATRQSVRAWPVIAPYIRRIVDPPRLKFLSRTFGDRHNDLHSITLSTNSMTTLKDIHPIVMKVLDELSEKYFIHKRPTIKKSDNLEPGWGGKGGRKTTINFTFITERPERSEIEREVKGILEDLL
jgi:hypothetical protein